MSSLALRLKPRRSNTSLIGTSPKCTTRCGARGFMCLRRCCSACSASASTRSALLMKIWSAKPTWRCASTRLFSCSGACLASTRVTMASSRKASAISSSMKKVCATGPGSATPVVSITTRSKSSSPLRFLAARSASVARKSSRMVQQMQPLLIWMICSCWSLTRMSLSMFSSPNSFSITAIFCPCASVSTRLSKVVLPDPRKPVRMVTGMRDMEANLRPATRRMGMRATSKTHSVAIERAACRPTAKPVGGNSSAR